MVFMPVFKIVSQTEVISYFFNTGRNGNIPDRRVCAERHPSNRCYAIRDNNAGHICLMLKSKVAYCFYVIWDDAVFTGHNQCFVFLCDDAIPLAVIIGIAVGDLKRLKSTPKIVEQTGDLFRNGEGSEMATYKWTREFNSILYISDAVAEVHISQVRASGERTGSDTPVRYRNACKTCAVHKSIGPDEFYRIGNNDTLQVGATAEGSGRSPLTVINGVYSCNSVFDNHGFDVCSVLKNSGINTCIAVECQNPVGVKRITHFYNSPVSIPASEFSFVYYGCGVCFQHQIQHWQQG